jgi:GntR family transcriptional regulator, transcriptional repressor for pyruvate dehydrogenase complex
MAVDSPEDAATSTAQRARSSTPERVSAWLFAYIREEGVEVGERLPTERDIADRCNVSRATVRQVLAAFQAQGIVRVRHGDGCYLVNHPEDQRALTRLLMRERPLAEVLEARAALELTIARLAAERRTETDLGAIRAALEAMRSEIEAGEVGVAGDAGFHQAVTAAAHNPLMAELLDYLGSDLGRVRAASLQTPGRPHQSLQQHAAIADAIERGDVAGAEEATREHIAAIVELVVTPGQDGPS